MGKGGLRGGGRVDGAARRANPTHTYRLPVDDELRSGVSLLALVEVQIPIDLPLIGAFIFALDYFQCYTLDSYLKNQRRPPTRGGCDHG